MEACLGYGKESGLTPQALGSRGWVGGNGSGSRGGRGHKQGIAEPERMVRKLSGDPAVRGDGELATTWREVDTCGICFRERGRGSAEGWECCEIRGVHEPPGASVMKHHRLGPLNHPSGVASWFWELEI